MNTILIIFMAVLILVLAILSGVMIERARQERKDLGRRVTELEETLKKRRHTYPTTAGLEDATSVDVELLIRYKTELEYITARLEQQMKILGEIRQGPLAYDPDRPCGKRKE